MTVTRLADVAEDERQTLGDRVYDHVRQLRISGRLAPGDRLSLRPLADVLGVSMMPVREAVSRLVTDRALEVVPNRAIRVPVMSNTQFAQLARIRIEVEGFAAALDCCCIVACDERAVQTRSIQRFDSREPSLVQGA
jgi:DNA-binding GntR family transcriptional regulator